MTEPFSFILLPFFLIPAALGAGTLRSASTAILLNGQTRKVGAGRAWLAPPQDSEAQKKQGSSEPHGLHGALRGEAEPTGPPSKTTKKPPGEEALFLFLSHQRVEDGAPFRQRAGHVDDPLVARTPEFQHERFFRQDEGAVDNDVELPQKISMAGVGKEVFEKISRIACQIIARLAQASGQRSQLRALRKGLAPAEGHAAHDGVFAHVREDPVRRNETPALEGVGQRVVAAFAAVRAALREQHVAQAGAVHDGFFHDAGYADVVVHRVCGASGDKGTPPP